MGDAVRKRISHSGLTPPPAPPVGPALPPTGTGHGDKEGVWDSVRGVDVRGSMAAPPIPSDDSDDDRVDVGQGRESMAPGWAPDASAGRPGIPYYQTRTMQQQGQANPFKRIVRHSRRSSVG